MTEDFDINIRPLSCAATASSSDLSVKIESPDDSDELDFGDVVKVELDIKNKRVLTGDWIVLELKDEAIASSTGQILSF